MVTSSIEFLPATLALRPPRVALLFADDERWRDWAMRALSVSSHYWGGGGFLLVPYARATGKPPEVFAEIVKAYDPDHVAVVRVSAADFESWYPGAIGIDGVDEVERLQLIADHTDELVDPLAETARQTVASWCSPLRSVWQEASERALEEVTELGEPASTDFRPTLPLSQHRGGSARASEHWRSNAGLAWASRFGVGLSGDERTEPEPATLAIHLRWNARVAPREDVRALQGSEWCREDPSVIRVTRGYVRDQTAIVLGDGAHDFALALAYDRLLGHGIWLPVSELENVELFQGELRNAYFDAAFSSNQRAERVVLTSATLESDVLKEWSDRLGEPRYSFQKRPAEDRVVRRAPKLSDGNAQLVLEEHLSASTVLPALIEVDGCRIAQTQIEVPIPAQSIASAPQSKPPFWYVDVSFANDPAPSGRDPSPTVLMASDSPFPAVMIRRSRGGVSYNAYSMGFVPSGAMLSSRIGKPRLRRLSLRAWVAAMLAHEGLDVRLSSPGRHAELVAERLGSRRALLELMAGGHLPMLREFRAVEKRPKERVASKVFLGLEPYLSFDEIAKFYSSEDEALDIIDVLVSAGLMRRGLILDCAICDRTSYIDVDQLGNQYVCTACKTTNPLESKRWRRGSEPRWYYDLFATLRDLVQTNGELPLLAADRLMRGSRRYFDTAEIELFQRSGSKSVAELDLVANVDDQVVIVEAKVAGAFPSAAARRAQAAKLMQAARLLRADRVVLATARSSWKPADVAELNRLAKAMGALGPRVEVMTDL